MRFLDQYATETAWQPGSARTRLAARSLGPHIVACMGRAQE